MAIKGIPQHHSKRKYHVRTFFAFGAYIAVLGFDGIKGGVTSWGNTREESIKNVFELGGRYIKTLDL